MMAVLPARARVSVGAPGLGQHPCRPGCSPVLLASRRYHAVIHPHLGRGLGSLAPSRRASTRRSPCRASSSQWLAHPTRDTLGVVILEMEGSGELLPAVASHYRKVTRRENVEVAHLKAVEPSLYQAVQGCMQRGATHIMIVPYLLARTASSQAAQQDLLPYLVADVQQQLPGIKCVMAEPIGMDNLLVDLIENRVKAVERRPVDVSERGWSGPQLGGGAAAERGWGQQVEAPRRRSPSPTARRQLPRRRSPSPVRRRPAQQGWSGDGAVSPERGWGAAQPAAAAERGWSGDGASAAERGWASQQSSPERSWAGSGSAAAERSWGGQAASPERGWAGSGSAAAAERSWDGQAASPERGRGASGAGSTGSPKRSWEREASAERSWGSQPTPVSPERGWAPAVAASAASPERGWSWEQGPTVEAEVQGPEYDWGGEQELGADGGRSRWDALLE